MINNPVMDFFNKKMKISRKVFTLLLHYNKTLFMVSEDLKECNNAVGLL